MCQTLEGSKTFSTIPNQKQTRRSLGTRPATAISAIMTFSVVTQEADSLFMFKLVLLSAGAGAVIKLGSVATHLPELQPTLPLGLTVVAASTLAATSPWCTPAPPPASHPLLKGQCFRATGSCCF